MKQLLQLKKFYEKKQDILNPIPVSSLSDSLLNKMLALILEGKVTTDDEMATAIYGPGADASYQPYQKLKNKFILYFIYKICSLPAESKVTPQNAKFACRTFYLHGKEAKARGMFRAAELLFLKACEIGEETELYSVVQDAAFELAEIYTNILPDKKGCNLYLHIFQNYASLDLIYFSLLTKASTLYQLFNSRDRRLTSHVQQLEEIEQEIRSQIDYNLVQYNSKIFLIYHKCLVDIAMLRADFHAMKEQALSALKQTVSNSFENHVKILFIDLLIIAYCKIGQYKECLDILNYRFQQTDNNTKLTPYVVRYYQIIALLHLKSYREAAQISETIKVDEVIKYHSEEQATTYYILFAYQFILFKTGQTSLEETPLHIQQFRFSRFRNRVQIQEKNKQGYNVHIIIIELFHLVLHQRFDAFIDRAEGINKYVIRYLNNAENMRNATFVRMLLSAAQFDFDPLILEQRMHQHFQELSSLENIAFNQDAASNEFLPFEVQWRLFLLALSQQQE